MEKVNFLLRDFNCSRITSIGLLYNRLDKIEDEAAGMKRQPLQRDELHF